jgi:hypothetical protein
MMPCVRSRNPLVLAVLLGVLACTPAVGAARPALTTDARCYLQGAPLQLTAAGLTPRTPLTVALDGRTLSYRDGTAPETDVAGMFESSFATPALAPGVAQQRHVLAVADGRHRPRTRFTVSRPTGGDFQPSSGNPRTLRARFSVWGFALVGGVAQARVWLHWLDPAGSVHATAALGVTGGDCGTLTTAPRRVFPFDPEAGRWTLVLDTQRRYRMQSDGPRARIPVNVRPLPH